MEIKQVTFETLKQDIYNLVAHLRMVNYKSEITGYAQYIYGQATLDNAMHLGKTVYNKAWTYAFPASNKKD
jgi:fido (protein-threonine AMPylation protein)